MKMHRIIGVAIAAGVMAAGAAEISPTGKLITSRLTANDLKADVSFLASDALQGRGTPSVGLDIAAEFIAAQFRRAGLEPAGDDGYFQTAQFANVTPNLDGLDFTLESGDKTVKAAKASMGLLEAEAVDLSHAGGMKISLDDTAAVNALTTEQVRGKILVIDSAGGRPVSTRRISGLAKLEPGLVVLLRANGQGVAATTRLREVAATNRVVPILVVWDPAVREVLEAAKPGALEGTFSAHVAAPTAVPVKLRNVVGVLRGSDPALKDTYVMVTAHYDHLGVRGTGEGDHIFNGANDDASGTASVIEIANTLALVPQRPKRSIVFVALFGEELGLVGSRYYAQHPIFPLAKTVADLNLEQMGRPDDVTGMRVGLVNVTGFDFTSLTEDLRKAGEEIGIQVVKDPEASDPFFARSDNQAFADAGIPSHTLSVGYEFAEYHKAGDEWPKLDYDNMAKVDESVALGIYRIADNEQAPQWNKENPKTAQYVKAHEALVSGTASK